MKNSLLTVVILGVLGWNIGYADARTLKPLTQRSPLSSSVQLARAIANRSTQIPANGTNITTPQGEQGRGTLTVKNGTANDAAVKLVDRNSGTTLRFVYIRANQTVTLEGISECQCVLRFTTGRQWDSTTRTFRQNPSFFQFREALNFQEIRTGDRIEWMTYTVTLHPVTGGKARINAINRNAF